MINPKDLFISGMRQISALFSLSYINQLFRNKIMKKIIAREQITINIIKKKQMIEYASFFLVLL